MLLCPWDFSGKSTEVGCHILLQGIFRIFDFWSGIKPVFPVSLALKVDSLPAEPLGKPEIITAAAAAKSLQSWPTLSGPMDCRLPGSSVHGIFQARVLEWGAYNELINVSITSHSYFFCLFVCLVGQAHLGSTFLANFKSRAQYCYLSSR